MCVHVLAGVCGEDEDGPVCRCSCIRVRACADARGQPKLLFPLQVARGISLLQAP